MILFWPEDQFTNVLLQAGVNAVLPYLEAQIEQFKKSSAIKNQRRATVKIADLTIDAWEAPKGRFGYYNWPVEPDRNKMLNLLIQINDKRLLRRFVSEVVSRDYGGKDKSEEGSEKSVGENEALATVAQLLGPEQSDALFANLVREHMRARQGHCVNL